jgi:hypothetical protein
MIRLPRRSVTRFFIPLIDVLTLLFCIFLLMPLVKATGDAQPPAAPASATDAGRLPSERPEGNRPAHDSAVLAREREELERLRKEREQLRYEKIETLQQRLFLRVLEIDAETGKLYYHEPDQRLEIANQADARVLIDRHRREAGGRELYYLFLFPRRLTGYPQEKQVQQYERWFEHVAHGFDNPRGRR